MTSNSSASSSSESAASLVEDQIVGNLINVFHPKFHSQGHCKLTITGLPHSGEDRAVPGGAWPFVP